MPESFAAAVDWAGSFFATDAAAAGGAAESAGVVGATAGSGAGAGFGLSEGALVGSGAALAGDSALAGAGTGLGADTSFEAGEYGAGLGAGSGSAFSDAAVDTSFGAGGAYGAGSGVSAISPDVTLPAAADGGLDATGAAGASFLPVTGTATSDGTLALDGNMAGALGMDGGAADTTFGEGGAYGAGSNVVAASPDVTLPAASDGGLDAGSAGGSWWDNATNWVGQHPLQTAQAGLLGTSLLEGTRTPKLPGQANAASSSAMQEVQQAQGIMASGGTSSPQWATMKSSIDAQVNQSLQTAIAQMEQSAATNGMGGKDSGVVQQQRATLEQRAAAQKSQMYEQALNQIVSQAASELSGGNQILTSIAGMQMQEDDEARQLANQIAQYGIELGLPGKTYGGSAGGP